MAPLVFQHYDANPHVAAQLRTDEEADDAAAAAVGDAPLRAKGTAIGRVPAVTADGTVWAVATAGGVGSTVAEQTRATLASLEATLEAAGASKHDIVDATICATPRPSCLLCFGLSCVGGRPDGHWQEGGDGLGVECVDTGGRVAVPSVRRGRAGAG